MYEDIALNQDSSEEEDVPSEHSKASISQNARRQIEIRKEEKLLNEQIRDYYDFDLS